MDFVTRRSFDFEGKAYEIRVASGDDGFKVAVFHNNRRANPYVYTADFITDQDFAHLQGARAYEHLMELAESDVRAKYWEKYVASMNAINASERR